MRLAAFFITTVLCAALSHADTVTTRSGRVVEGIVLQETSAAVVVKLPYGTMTMPRSAVASVKRDAKAAAPQATSSAPRPRIAGWTDVITTLSAAPWASGLRQIPATVIDVGALRRVPYQSFYCGDGYELNIYGDPDDPACVEIGYQKGAPNDAAKRQCVAFMAALLGEAKDVAILKSLDLKKEIVTRNGLTMEVTPPDGADAYGGWWVSVYDEVKLDRARAPEKELEEITVSRSRKPVPAVAAVRPTAVAQQEPVEDSWSEEDYRYTRKRASTALKSSDGDRVYVRGYYRKNGTYVRPYTRSRTGGKRR